MIKSFNQTNSSGMEHSSSPSVGISGLEISDLYNSRGTSCIAPESIPTLKSLAAKIINGGFTYVLVCGTSGVGKTSFGQILAATLQTMLFAADDARPVFFTDVDSAGYRDQDEEWVYDPDWLAQYQSVVNVNDGIIVSAGTSNQMAYWPFEDAESSKVVKILLSVSPETLHARWQIRAQYGERPDLMKVSNFQTALEKEAAIFSSYPYVDASTRPIMLDATPQDQGCGRYYTFLFTNGTCRFKAFGCNTRDNRTMRGALNMFIVSPVGPYALLMTTLGVTSGWRNDPNDPTLKVYDSRVRDLTFRLHNASRSATHLS